MSHQPISAQELDSELSAIRALRGKKRQAAVDALGARHDDLLPALVAYVEDPNQSTRKLVHGIFRSIEPRTKDGVAAMCEAIATMLSSSKPTVRELALGSMESLGSLARAAAPALCELMGREVEESMLLRAVAIIGELGMAKTKMIKAMDPALDSWSEPVRKAAAKCVRAAGGSPRASAWQGAPLAPEVIKQIQRLGGTCQTPFHAKAPRPGDSFASFYSRTHGSWSGADPDGELTSIPAAVVFFDNHIRWSRGSVFATYDRDFPDRKISMTGASENFDTEIHGERHLLYIIAYDELTQFYSCLNLFDDSDNPPVYSIDHDGSDPYPKYRSLSAFLAELRAP